MTKEEFLDRIIIEINLLIDIFLNSVHDFTSKLTERVAEIRKLSHE